MAVLQKKANNKEQEEKDREFQELMRSIDMESAHRVHSIKSKKKELRVSQRESKKKVEKIKQARSQDYVTSAETKELMNRTWQEMELTAKAHTFSEWCSECNCIHLDKLLEDEAHDDAEAGAGDATADGEQASN